MAKKNLATVVPQVKTILGYMTQDEADARYPQVSEGEAIEIYSKSQIDAMFPTPYAQKIVEQKARVASQNIAYTGTVRMVGVGQTYTTLTAAYAAAANGDILQLIDGTYDLAAESGGYWLINTNTKGVLVRGNASNNGAVILAQTSATYGIRMRDANSMTFENITFTSAQNYSNGIINHEVYANNNYFKAKNCVFTNTNTGTSARIFNRAATIGSTTAIHIEFERCTFNHSGTSSSPVAITTTGVNEVLLFNKCTFNSSSITINYSSNNKGTLAVYDCSFMQNANVSGMLLGENTDVPVYTTARYDIRNNIFNAYSGFADHAILAGRGTDFIYCVNNTFHAPANDNGNNMALVIKSIASVVGNAYFAGNYMSSARPIYLKGAKNCIIKYNTMISNVPTWECLSVTNPASDLLCTGNIIIQNNFIGGDKAIKCYPSSGYDSAATSLKTCTLDNNRYYTSTDNWFVDDATNYTFANKYSIWTNYNDNYSSLVTSTTIIFDTKLIVDNTTVN